MFNVSNESDGSQPGMKFHWQICLATTTTMRAAMPDGNNIDNDGKIFVEIKQSEASDEFKCPDCVARVCVQCVPVPVWRADR